MTTGERIAFHRRRCGISQEELGARLNVSRQAVSKWETDLSVPDMAHLLALSREFSVPLSDLTATPEADFSPAAPLPKAKAAPPLLPALCLIFAACLALGGFLLLYQRRPAEEGGGQTPPSEESPDSQRWPNTDFALILDWTERGEFLELGAQETDYPFGATFFTEPQEMGRSDWGDTVYYLDDLAGSGIRLTYSQREEGPFIIKIETAQTKEVSTPRSIHVGSTRSEVVGAYGTDLVYCLKDEEEAPLAEHDYYYAYQELSPALCFYMKDGRVCAIRAEHMLDAGNEAYAVNNLSRFPIRPDGEPDYTHRQFPYEEPMDAAKRVYIAWNKLATYETLSAEERYTYRGQIFSGLPEMDWQSFGALGTTDAFSTAAALTDYLKDQAPYSVSELIFIQMGSAAPGLDGAWAENYCALLAQALFAGPVDYARALCRTAEYDESLPADVLRRTAYGADYHADACQRAADALSAAIEAPNALTEEEAGWARLLHYYLANPNDGSYGDYPKTPAELPAE